VRGSDAVHLCDVASSDLYSLKLSTFVSPHQDTEIRQEQKKKAL